MSYASETSLVPIRPPGEDELPHDDGEPMESDRHRKQMLLLIESLDLFWKDRDDVYVSGNMAIYFSELQTMKNDFRGPDVFVVLDTVRRDRKSWVVWQENGRTPDLVIELLSESTESVDRGEKMRVYAKLLRVPEYFLFDPMKNVLEGYALDISSRGYRPMVSSADGELVSQQLGLRLGVRDGLYLASRGSWLRWLDPEGRVLPTAEEQARAAEEQARAAEERAQALADKLAAYEKRFGPLT
ncbi:Uma2 family endonuclease [Sorangium sp. So ce1078]|uniref:Uma2 family endonuclease n=1 Tax=Sorangium sp. So ce1078 TaxID=3133329 RepID=UPI003F62ACCB